MTDQEKQVPENKQATDPEMDAKLAEANSYVGRLEALEKGVESKVAGIIASGEKALSQCSSVGEMRRVNRMINEAIRIHTKWARKEDWS